MHSGLDRNPVGAYVQHLGWRQRNSESACRRFHIRLAYEGAHGSSRQTASVRVKGYIEINCRSSAIEINPGSDDLLDCPLKAGWDDEVIGELIIEGIISRLKVLRNGCVGSGTAGLVIQDGEHGIGLS